MAARNRDPWGAPSSEAPMTAATPELMAGKTCLSIKRFIESWDGWLRWQTVADWKEYQLYSKHYKVYPDEMPDDTPFRGLNHKRFLRARTIIYEPLFRN